MSALVSFMADASTTILNGANAACSGGACNNSLTVATLFKNVTNTLIFIVGAVSVIMIIYGGFRYVISRGDSAQIATAKNTLIYAIAGVVVAIVAFAIVNFVVTNIGR